MKSYFLTGLMLIFTLAFSACSFAPDSFVKDDLDQTVEEDVLPDEPIVIDSELLQATDDFFLALEEGEDAAYAATHELFKVYTNEEDFASFMDEFPVFRDHDSYEFDDFSIDGETASMSGFMESETYGSYEINFLYDRNTEGVWEVSGFDILLL